MKTKIMTTEIYLSDLDYTALKQQLEYSACVKIDNQLFNDYYYNLSYFVPNNILSDKYKVIEFIVDMLVADYQTIQF